MSLELYAQPRGGNGVDGPDPRAEPGDGAGDDGGAAGEQARAGGGGARREPSRQLLSRRGASCGHCRDSRPGSCSTSTTRRRYCWPRNSPKTPLARPLMATARAIERRSFAAAGLGRVRQRRVPCSGGARGVAARGLRGRVERMVVAGCATGSALAGRRRASAGVRRHDQRAGQRRPPRGCARGPADIAAALRVVVAGSGSALAGGQAAGARARGRADRSNGSGS